MQLVLEQRPAEFLLHQALALARVLPVGEAHLLHDVVDVGDDALDDDVGVLALGLLEQLGQGFLGPVALLLRVGFLLGLDDLLGQLEDLLQELQAGEEALLVALLDLLQPLAQRGELRVAQVLAQAGDELDLDLLAPSSPGRRPSGFPPAPERP